MTELERPMLAKTQLNIAMNWYVFRIAPPKNSLPHFTLSWRQTLCPRFHML
jgi:hypothetical protein